MYAKLRKIYNLNGLRVVPLPNGTPVGKMASVAGDRLFLVDPEGDFEPEELLELVKNLEPDIWKRLESRKSRAKVPLHGDSLSKEGAERALAKADLPKAQYG